MKLGVNTVELFSGDHLVLNVLADLDDLSLVEQVQRLHGELGVDLVELPANMLVICPQLFTERTIKALADYQANPGWVTRCIYPFGVWIFPPWPSPSGKPA